MIRALDAGAPGLVTFALATDGVRREAAGLRAAGSPISEAIPGRRTRPDGAVVAWQCAFPPVLGPGEPPFLIEHEPAGPEWGDEARRARARFVHPFGGSARLVGLELAVPDPAAAAGSWERTVGVVLLPGAGAVPGEREGRVGEHGIRLVPASAAAADVVPPARIGIAGTAGPHALVDLFGVRIARL